MRIRKMEITVKELCEGYINESETDIEQGVYAYSQIASSSMMAKK